MDLNGARVPVAGATGILGRPLTAELAGRGVRPTLAGHDPVRLARASEAFPGASAHRFLAPAAFFRAALPLMAPGSLVAAFTGVAAQAPHAPSMPEGGDPRQVVAAPADAVAADAALPRTGRDGTPVVERRAR